SFHRGRESSTLRRAALATAGQSLLRPAAGRQRSRSWLLLRRNVEFVVQWGKVAVDLFQLVEGRALVLYPGMRFKKVHVFANANAHAGGNSLQPQQIPEGERCFEAARSGHAIVDRGTNHAASLLHDVLAAGGLRQGLVAALPSGLQPLLCPPITAQAQRYPDKRKKYCGTPKHLPRFGIQRSIPLEWFPHCRSQY